MKVKIKRFDKSLPLPEYKTAGAVAFDLPVRNEEVIAPGEVKLVATGLGLKIPKGYFLWIAPRSSTLLKHHLLASAGVIDQDYCGNEDEIHVQIINVSREPVKIERGWRLAQGIFVKFSKFEFTEVRVMTNKSRGGFGTTGH
ncbi:dUTP diphosphatase [Patescibacteria group bacterium]|nr:dUTP diphosphatase [Patescibacteria group bacterium]